MPFHFNDHFGVLKEIIDKPAEQFNVPQITTQQILLLILWL